MNMGEEWTPCPQPLCNRSAEAHHYHCGSCGRPCGVQGHYVGGARLDARVICDDNERSAYVLGLLKGKRKQK
jgi:hypothetical protein